MDGDGDADQGYCNEDPAQGIEVGHQGQDGGLGFREDVLCHFDPGGTDGREACRPAAFQGAAVGEGFAGGVSGTKGVARGAKGSPQLRAGSRSMCMKPERG